MGQVSGCVKVDQSNVALREQFGKFDKVLEHGCHCVPWCIGSQVRGDITLRIQKLDVRCETKSKDNVFVTGVASVQFRMLMEKATDAVYKLSNTREQIQAYVFDAARMREAARDKAEAQKILQIKKAEGEESKYFSRVGIARQRQAIVDGLRDSVLAFSENVPGTNARDVMDMVLVTRYFDTKQ